MFIRNRDPDLVEVFCKQTRVWRDTLVNSNLPYYCEQISYESDLRATFRDQVAEINGEASRPTRFLLTGTASLISRILDGYESIVMARQIRHLANNQQVLFTNQERIIGTHAINPTTEPSHSKPNHLGYEYIKEKIQKCREK